MNNVTRSRIWAAKLVAWAACLAPSGRLVYLGLAGRLTANPIEFITLSTGTWALALLMVTLSITPLCRLPGLNGLIRLRRLTGLFAFFYGTLHFLAYVWLDKFFDFPDMVRDVVKRPFITAGFAAFVLLIPLALTSTTPAIRRMGEKRWERLHRLAYLSAVAGVAHYWWKVKADIRNPLIFAVLLALFMACRAAAWLRCRRSAAVGPVDR